jgi:hypothetical protein
LLQSSLPCSENFFRYKKNYEKFINQNGGPDDAASVKSGDVSENSSVN